MSLQLQHWNCEEQGELTETAMRLQLESLGYHVTRYTYPPGTAFPAHAHNVDKIDGVLSGEFKMTMQGQSVVLKAGDTLIVPKGMIHTAEVVGKDPVVSLDAVKY